jgi:ribosomal protein S7
MREKRKKGRIKSGDKEGTEKRRRKRRSDLEYMYGKKGESVRREVRTERKPVRETKTIKQGGGAYQVPVGVSNERGRHLGRRWLREGINKRSKKDGRGKWEARRREVGEVYEERKRRKEGKKDTIKKDGSERRKNREKRHRVAKANRVYAKRR